MTRRLLLSGALAATALLGALAGAGCSSVGGDGGGDMAYLRVPTSEEEPALTDPLSSLFPTGSSRRWEMRVNATGQSERTDQIRVGSQKPLGDGTTAVRLDFVQSGKLYREETYGVSRSAIRLISAGGDDRMTMSPPMTLVKADLPEGKPLLWEGSILFKGKKAPARAYGRIASKRKVTTPAGTFDAYRVDTVLTTVIDGRPLSFPASRWFSPGIGIVKQEFIVGRAQVVKELTKYSEE